MERASVCRRRAGRRRPRGPLASTFRPGRALVVVLLAAGCGGDARPGDAGLAPFAPAVLGLPADDTVPKDGLRAAVHVVFDAFEVPHIYARYEHDVFFMQGYLHALHRWPQLELGRRTAAGTLSEFVGGVDEGVVRDDLRIRILGIPAAGRAEWAALDAAGGREREALVAYAEGVNRFLAEWRAGERDLPAGTELLLDRDRAVDWTPQDSVILARYVAFLLQYDGRLEAEMTDVWQRFSATFRADAADAALAARAGIWQDLAGHRPAVEVSHIDGFPNLPADTGARAKPAPPVRRPAVPGPLLDAATRFLVDGNGASNSWVVHGDLTEGGHPLLASDPHAALDSPAFAWVVHLNVDAAGTADGQELSLHGIALPGLPLVFMGFNEALAWATTTASYDYTDLYLEQVTPGRDGAPDTVLFDGAQVPIETVHETLKIGFAGQIHEERAVSWQRVPHHGPLVPDGEDRGLVDGATQRLSVRFVDGIAEHRVVPFIGIAFSRTVQEAEEALDAFGAGGANWTVATTTGDIFYSGSSFIPVRPAACASFHPVTNPGGVAPFFVLPGTGECEWQGGLEDRYIPHALNPARGFVVTANEDQVGVTFDNDPLNDPHYIGYDYADGFRGGRITELLDAGGAGHTMRSMSAIQHDVQSGFGRWAAPYAVAAVDAAAAGEHGLGVRRDALGDAFPRLQDLADRLRTWDYEASVESVSTSIHSVWFTFLMADALDDECGAAGTCPGVTERSVAVLRMLKDMDALAVRDAAGESVLWDDLRTPGVVETRWDIAFGAWEKALPKLAELFGGEDPDDWTWGTLHRKKFASALPSLGGPSFDYTPPDGVPRPGDRSNVNVCNGGVTGFGFECGVGPIQRLVVELDPAGVRATLEIPGGQVWDPGTPHFRDQLPGWLAHDPRPVPFHEAEVVAAKGRKVVYTP